MRWTVFDPATRKILYSGSGKLPPVNIPAGAEWIAGVSGDPATQRMTGNRQSVEARPEASVSLSSLTVGELEPTTVTVPEQSRVFVDGALFATLEAETEYAVAFEEAGTYRVDVVPVSSETAALPRQIEVTVTPGGTPAPADLTVPEKQNTLLGAARNKLAEFDIAITRAEAREADAAAVEAAASGITTIAQVKAALEELARIEKQTNNDLAAIVRHNRRALYALVEITTRGRG